jgi:large subunit ribosomal protein L17
MIHISKKIKFKDGHDSTRMITYKLVVNFLNSGKMDVTLKRAKVIKAKVDRLVSHAKKGNSKDEVVMNQIHNKKVLEKFTKEIVPALADRSFGYVTVKRLGSRVGDGAEMARIQWVTPIGKAASQTPAEEPKVTEPVVKTEEKKVEKKKTIKK